MNRRQVLFGAGVSAIAFSGFVPWNKAYAADTELAANSFAALAMGTRGTVTLNGTLILSGTVNGVAPSPAPHAKAAPVAQAVPLASEKTAPPAGQPAAAATPSAAVTPARQPMMSIVSVPRGNTRRDVATTH